MYRKEIIYVGLHQNGSRLGTAGFLKVENADAQSKLFLKLQNIPHAINGRFPVRIYNGTDWKEIEGAAVENGCGLWEARIDGGLEKVRLQIILPDGYLIEGQSKAAEQNVPSYRERTPEAGEAPRMERPSEAKEAPRMERKPEAKEAPRMERMSEAQEEPRMERIPEAEKLPYREQKKEQMTAQHHEWRPEQKSAALDRQRAESCTAAKLPDRNRLQPACVKEDKWEQILSSYEQIHPYGDERVYVKIEPKDFIILPSQYQHLVNNSFLLHGFYNYRYVILGKEGDYYLGVPGVFYQREKMVALMFGFEAFECEDGVAEEGKFGYYLRKVEL